MRKTPSTLVLRRHSIRLLAAPTLHDVRGGETQGVSDDLTGAQSVKTCTHTIAPTDLCAKPTK
jgi:hypothetical protein